MSETGARPGLRWLFVSFLVIVLDRWTKWLALEHLDLHRPVAVVPSLNFTLTHNTGAAFSFLSDAGGWQRWLFIGFAAVVSIFLVAWLRQVRAGERLTPAALALVLGGALGNLWDRVAYGAVIDFIDAYYGRWHWPAFNVADSAISVGAVLLVLTTLRPDAGAQAPPSG